MLMEIGGSPLFHFKNTSAARLTEQLQNILRKAAGILSMHDGFFADMLV